MSAHSSERYGLTEKAGAPAPGSDAKPRAEPEWGVSAPNARASFLLALSRTIGLGQRYLRGRLQELHPDFVDMRLWDVPMRLYPWDSRSDYDALVLRGRPEAKEYAHIGHIMADHRAVFVDIGAGSGLFSLHAAIASVDGGRILVVERDPELVRRFTFNLALARRAGRVKEGVEIDISTDPLSATAALDPANADQLGAPMGRHAIMRIDIMRVDLQGIEGRALASFFAGVNGRRWPKVLIVVHASETARPVDCIEDCVRRGYRVKAITRYSTILRR